MSGKYRQRYMVEVRLVTTVDSDQVSAASLTQALMDRAYQLATAPANEVFEAFGHPIRIESPADELHESEIGDADLVVFVSLGDDGVRRWIMGSVDLTGDGDFTYGSTRDVGKARICRRDDAKRLLPTIRGTYANALTELAPTP